MSDASARAFLRAGARSVVAGIEDRSAVDQVERLEVAGETLVDPGGYSVASRGREKLVQSFVGEDGEAAVLGAVVGNGHASFGETAAADAHVSIRPSWGKLPGEAFPLGAALKEVGRQGGRSHGVGREQLDIGPVAGLEEPGQGLDERFALAGGVDHIVVGGQLGPGRALKGPIGGGEVDLFPAEFGGAAHE
jgi:hypothetical protein